MTCCMKCIGPPATGTSGKSGGSPRGGGRGRTVAGGNAATGEKRPRQPNKRRRIDTDSQGNAVLPDSLYDQGPSSTMATTSKIAKTPKHQAMNTAASTSQIGGPDQARKISDYLKKVCCQRCHPDGWCLGAGAGARNISVSTAAVESAAGRRTATTIFDEQHASNTNARSDKCALRSQRVCSAGAVSTGVCVRRSRSTTISCTATHRRRHGCSQGNADTSSRAHRHRRRKYGDGER
jgi:hypothetical protein